jgi:sodium/bile acid cotransporter 7
MWARLAKQWFLLALGCCFALGYVAAGPLEPLLRQTVLRSGIVFSVMWAMGVTLRADTIRRSLARPLPSLLAIGINVAIVPLLCMPAAWLLPDFLFGGLFVATIAPCTLASASVWTRKAGGDDSIAMMTTVVTNLACLLVVPIGISLVLAETTEVSATDQMGKLATVVVAPLVLAQIMRRLGLASWADRNKPRLAIYGQCGILSMVVFGAVAGAGAVKNAPTDVITWTDGLSTIGAAVGVHVVALVTGIALARRLQVRRDGQIAIGIAGSQKTLMVGLQIAIDCGVSVVPMLIYHLGQLLIDTLVAQRWKAAAGSEPTDSPES